MRNSVALCMWFLLAVSCASSQKSVSNKDKQKIKASVRNVLDDWHKAAADANFDNYFGKMDSVSVFIGTDASENWTKKQFETFSKPYFKKGKAWSFMPLERNIYINKRGDFVWFDELLSTWMGTCRGSGVLEYVNNTWMIKHYVLSITIPNDDVQKVIAAKKKNDAIFLKKFKQ